MMKKSVKLALFTGFLAAAAALGGAAALGQPSPQEQYQALLAQGVITQAEYDKLERFDFQLPQNEKEPIDDFVVGEIATGVNTHEANTREAGVS